MTRRLSNYRYIVNKICKKTEGFIALAIVLSVSSILLALVFTSSIESGLFFDQVMRKEYRTMNYFYAYDCLDQAMLYLSHDYFFSTINPIEIPEFHCFILSIERQGDILNIKSKANFMDALVYRNAKVRLHDHNLEIISLD